MESVHALAQNWAGLKTLGGEQEQQRWSQSLLRAVQLLQPLIPERTSSLVWSPSPPVAALVIYALLPDADPAMVDARQLLDALAVPPGQEWVGDRLAAALAARGQAQGDLTRWLAPLRLAPSVADYERDGGPDPLTLPSDLAPDFREPLAATIEWIESALKRTLRADAAV